MLSISSEQLQDLLHAQLTGSALTTFDGLVSELAFLLLEIEDSLFDAVFDSDFVYYYVNFLGEAVNSVDCLFFDELGLVSLWYSDGVRTKGTYGIPERLENYHTGCSCEV
jgi:hypothetical protein